MTSQSNFKIAPLAAVAALIASQSVAGGLTPAAMEPAVIPVSVPVARMIPSDWTGFYAGAQAGFGTVTATDGDDEADVDFNAFGVHAGYNYDLGSYVVGGEAAYDSADLDFFDGDNSVFRAGVRAGYDAGKILPFATAGYTYLNGETNGADGEGSGYYFGFGADYAVTPNVIAGAQLLRHQYDDFNDSGVDIQADTAQLRVSYKF